LTRRFYFDIYRNMEIENATIRFQALANETRLAAFRRIVAAGKPGIRAGELAEALQVPPSTMSGHLATLEHAELVQSWRVQRSIFYAVREGGVPDLIRYLTEDCCRGAPELCGFAAQKARPVKKARRSA
jgi:DNA-binding transcriptional ArsR family regulator